MMYNVKPINCVIITTEGVLIVQTVENTVESFFSVCQELDITQYFNGRRTEIRSKNTGQNIS